jgi:hypothetical protein
MAKKGCNAVMPRLGDIAVEGGGKGLRCSSSQGDKRLGLTGLRRRVEAAGPHWTTTWAMHKRGMGGQAGPAGWNSAHGQYKIGKSVFNFQKNSKF